MSDDFLSYIFIFLYIPNLSNSIDSLVYTKYEFFLNNSIDIRKELFFQ